LEWLRTKDNLALVGPPGTAKSHVLVALGHAAVDAGYRVRYFVAAELVDTLYRGLADNSVGRVIETILRADLVIVDELGFAPLDDTGAQLLFRLVSGAYEHRSLAIASHWPFEQWGRFLPEHTTAASLLDRLLHHATVVVTAGESYRMRQAKARRSVKPGTCSSAPTTATTGRPTNPQSTPPRSRRRQPKRRKPERRAGTSNWPPVGTTTWPLTMISAGLEPRSCAGSTRCSASSSRAVSPRR
jgi:hypothetical protein